MSASCHCTICKEKFNEPRGLPCTHRFCTECLQKYIDKNLYLGVFSCPSCLENILLPDNLTTIKKLAYTFPIDNILVEIMEKFDTHKKMNLSSEVCCNICKQQNGTRVDTMAFCRDCKVDLCPCCFHKHQQNHSLMVCRNFTKSPLLQQKDAHPDSFCKKCNVFTYTELVQSKHTTCENDVISLEDVTEEGEKKISDLSPLKV